MTYVSRSPVFLDERLTVVEAAAGADLFIAEANYRDKNVPIFRYCDLEAHRDRLTARRVLLIHMSADMLGHHSGNCFESV